MTGAAAKSNDATTEEKVARALAGLARPLRVRNADKRKVRRGRRRLTPQQVRLMQQVMQERLRALSAEAADILGVPVVGVLYPAPHLRRRKRS
jgi:hypothetical protein